jgi:hypothetical protein
VSTGTQLLLFYTSATSTIVDVEDENPRIACFKNVDVAKKYMHLLFYCQDDTGLKSGIDQLRLRSN